MIAARILAINTISISFGPVCGSFSQTTSPLATVPLQPVGVTDPPIVGVVFVGEAVPDTGAALSGVSAGVIPPLATRVPARAVFLSTTRPFHPVAPFLSYLTSPTPIDPSALYLTSFAPIHLLTSTPGTASSANAVCIIQRDRIIKRTFFINKLIRYIFYTVYILLKKQNYFFSTACINIKIL